MGNPLMGNPLMGNPSPGPRPNELSAAATRPENGWAKSRAELSFCCSPAEPWQASWANFSQPISGWYRRLVVNDAGKADGIQGCSPHEHPINLLLGHQAIDCGGVHRAPVLDHNIFLTNPAAD